MRKCVTSVLLSSALPLAVAAQERPNVIIFLIDDMGVMDTSVEFLTSSEGVAERFPLNDWYRTPSMERLAERGVRFTNFYAQNVSSPSRASILTGQNSVRHRTTNWINPEYNNRDDYGPMQWNWKGLTAEDVTLPKLMKEAGYQTIHIGKAHFGPAGSEGADPCNLGFDINLGGSSIGQPGSYYGEDGYGHIGGNKIRAVDGLEKYHGTDTFLTEALTIEAKELITRAVEDGRPFYLNFAHYAVHTPFQADKRFIDNYPQSEDKSKPACAYASLIEGMDKSLGDLLDHLEALEIADNTLIIFLGDNGSDAPLGSEVGHFSSAPLRGKKGSVYEGGVRVPFIAAWAESDPESRCQQRFVINSGEIMSERATIMDIFPTILKLADVDNPKGHAVDGSPLWRLFRGEKDPKHSSDILLHFPHEHRGSYFSSYIEEGWKVIYHYNPESPDKPTYELYDLNNDPYEENDLSKTEAFKLYKMVGAMSRLLKKEQALPPVDGDGKELLPILPAL